MSFGRLKFLSLLTPFVRFMISKLSPMRRWQVFAICVAVGCYPMVYAIWNVMCPPYRVDLGRLSYGEHLLCGPRVTSQGDYLVKI